MAETTNRLIIIYKLISFIDDFYPIFILIFCPWLLESKRKLKTKKVRKRRSTSKSTWPTITLVGFTAFKLKKK